MRHSLFFQNAARLNVDAAIDGLVAHRHQWLSWMRVAQASPISVRATIVWQAFEPPCVAVVHGRRVDKPWGATRACRRDGRLCTHGTDECHHGEVSLGSPSMANDQDR